MAPIQVREISHADTSITEWVTPDEAHFVDRVIATAEDARAQAPFVIPSTFTTEQATFAGIPALEGKSGAFIFFDDATTRFVSATAGQIIATGSGAVVADDLANRVDICREWLQTAHRCTVELAHVASPTAAAIAAWLEAEDAQASALRAALESLPDDLAHEAPLVAKTRVPAHIMAAISAATDARSKAYRALPSPVASTGGVQ